MSKKGNDTPSSIRIRENQRRSRNQRKELIQDLQRRVQEYEAKGIAATQEMQRAARKVAEENARLKSLLASRGVSHEEVDAYLRSFDAASAPSPSAAALFAQPAMRPQASLTPAQSSVGYAKYPSLDNGLLISCETAATIISEMRGDGDRHRIRASLGCQGDQECSVKNTLVLELMDER
ncbi:hypothetical protein BKA58DRAFT_363821 [Alternaria rosae]|uniref:uncharacterized protein n=1 Tax=Alternaria rosae TaxID=1187941 RepID=UPI001E8ECBFF|nr:uncharacterized protein BKA58DRAFT_363821 [Alternaria rosae]KAH6866465.1 hypothetical protein BKA58DRAFT_363821 [Alternaria rosae]